jgi:hypothetical protein
MQVNALFASSCLGLVGVTQGTKAIGMLLQVAFERSFAQRGHSLAGFSSSTEVAN